MIDIYDKAEINFRILLHAPERGHLDSMFWFHYGTEEGKEYKVVQ
jgi:hypothetical protein